MLYKNMLGKIQYNESKRERMVCDMKYGETRLKFEKPQHCKYTLLTISH